jgi:tetratricopeptide (TPR) repeat protein
LQQAQVPCLVEPAANDGVEAERHSSAPARAETGGSLAPQAVAPTAHVWISDYSNSALPDIEAGNQWSRFWESRGRQIFNFAYFSAGVLAFFFIACTCDLVYWPAMAGVGIFAILGSGALVYSIFHRHPVGESDALSLRTKKNLRRFALIAPLVAMLFAAWNLLGQVYLLHWYQVSCSGSYLARVNQEQFKADRRQAYEIASNLSPFNTMLIDTSYRGASWNEDFDQAVSFLDRKIFLHPFDDHLKITRMGMLGQAPGRENEFASLAEQYKKSFAKDGFLWNTLADVAVKKKDWPVALEMANQHVQIHDKEAMAYKQRGEILQQLGQTQEAEVDLAKARVLEGNK